MKPQRRFAGDGGGWEGMEEEEKKEQRIMGRGFRAFPCQERRRGEKSGR